MTSPTCFGVLAAVVTQQLEALVVGAGSDEVAHRTPRYAVDGTFVVLLALEQRGRLARLVTSSGDKRRLNQHCDDGDVSPDITRVGKRHHAQDLGVRPHRVAITLQHITA